MLVKENEVKDISISDYQMILEKLKNVQVQNEQLKKAITKRDKNIKELRRVIQKLKEVARKGKKQHYKNGKRGTKFNG